MGRRITAIAVAAIVALLGAVLVLLYARGADSRAVVAASPTKVFVTNAQVPAGTSLKDAVRLGQIVETEVAARAKPAGALEKVDETNSNLLALTDIAPGTYVLSAAFGETPMGEKALTVSPGKLAVSVQLADPARVGNFVTPGSFLTIFMTYDLKQLASSGKAADEEAVKATSVLLDNVKVIAMGDASLTPVQGQAAAGTEAQASPGFLVTLEVSPAQAARLVHGINNYTLYAGLRGPELKIDPRLGVSDQNILKGSVS